MTNDFFRKRLDKMIDLRLLRASGLAGLFEKWVEIVRPNRLQRSDQRWAMA